MPDMSRRRAISTAAVFAATAVLSPVLRPRFAMSQSIGPEAALTRLFSADQLDPAWFSPTLLKRASLQQLQASVNGFRGLFGSFQSVLPGTSDSYNVNFTGGSVELSVTVDEQGRIASLAALGVSYALAADEQEVQFASGSDTLYGTLLLPEGVTAPPAALLIAGSGPTDRNGNSPLLGLQVNTLASLARALADAGVASLRYDKLASGKTGTAGHSSPDFDFNTFLDEALAAAAALTARPEIDASRLLLVGHSEGGLFAELLAQQLPSLSGLILAAPLGARALDTLRRQLTAQLDTALAARQLSQNAYDRLSADLDRTIASIRQNGTIPAGLFADAPDLRALFAPSIGAFFQQEDRYDPAQLAMQLPVALPVLLLRGGLDTNVDQYDIQRLLDGFHAAGNATVQRGEFANVDHELRQLPPGQGPSFNVSYPVSSAVQDAVTGFAATVFG